jgi:hypothetical protein
MRLSILSRILSALLSRQAKRHTSLTAAWTGQIQLFTIGIN